MAKIVRGATIRTGYAAYGYGSGSPPIIGAATWVSGVKKYRRNCLKECSRKYRNCLEVCIVKVRAADGTANGTIIEVLPFEPSDEDRAIRLENQLDKI